MSMPAFAVHVRVPAGLHICWVVCCQDAETAARHVLDLATPGSTLIEVHDFLPPVDETSGAEMIWLEEERR